ncbi:MAG: hypothetical protein H0W84_06720 [Bacteroidetes bacterium]|nr:hypothetical protein [Bacteroidota bacterium]
MKTEKKVSAPGQKKIKVQLDHCTYATISRMSSLKVWQKRFPEAKIMT